MIIRNIVQDELSKFCRVGLEEEKALKFEHNLQKAWNEERSFPEWCFVVEENDGFTARLAFDRFPTETCNLLLWRFYVPDNKEYFSTGKMLFSEAFKHLKKSGIRSIDYHLYSDDDESFKKVSKLLSMCGFTIIQEKKSYTFKNDSLPQITYRPRFKTLHETGKDEFINSIRRVTESTLDRDYEHDVHLYGPEEASIYNFNMLRDIDYNENWWRLAYDKSGDFIGLVIPQKFNDDVGAINYIGVEPSKRGNGYVNDLLVMGTATLKDAGIKEIIADVDINNFPMEKSLVSMEYKFTKNELVFKIQL